MLPFVIVVLLAGAALAQTKEVPPAIRNNQTGYPSRRATGEMSPEEIFASFAGRILFLTCELSSGDEAQASGVLISEDGFVVTNAHVVEGCRNLTATHINGASHRPYQAALKYYDKQSDTAVLKIEGHGFGFFDLLARNVRVGERVYAIGNPQGLEQSISEGIVSGLRAEDGASWIQHSAPISPGSSGGALISSRGELLGINSWYGKESQNLNFAVPASTLAAAYRHAQALRGALKFPELRADSQTEVLSSDGALPKASVPAPSSLPSEPGRDVAQDDVESVKGLRKAADQGLAEAQYDLGSAYAEGRGVAQDYAEAAKWYRKAADQGLAEAQYDLGSAYAEGRGVAQDYAEAAKWYRKAADQGLAEAQYDLGLSYDMGLGVASDHAEAVKWIRRAGDRGLADAQYDLGVRYEVGENVPHNDSEAAKWFQKAADQGLAEAQDSLGDAYRFGSGVAQDDGEAAKWYRKAADQGLADGQYDLGSVYAEGRGVGQDYANAAKWYRKAADQGLAEAQYDLGSAYAEGRGVAQDYVLAHMWYNLAASRSTGRRQKERSGRRDSLAGKMTAAQIAEAQRLAREWKPGAQKLPQP